MAVVVGNRLRSLTVRRITTLGLIASSVPNADAVKIVYADDDDDFGTDADDALTQMTQIKSAVEGRLKVEMELGNLNLFVPVQVFVTHAT